jgi:hypothetical protein
MGIKKFLKKNTPQPERKLLQARVRLDLYEKLRAKLRRENVDIQEFMEASIQAYLEE